MPAFDSESTIRPEAIPPSGEEQWQTVRNIAASAAFHKSPRLRNLLLFVVERSITGRGNELTELEIGRQVFGRGSEYVPADDSVVRSSVRQLRLKLMEFYEVEGQCEPWLLEIPKGTYVAAFRRRESDVPVAAAPVAESGTAGATNQQPWKSNAVLLPLALIAIVSLAVNLFLWDRQNSGANPRGWSPSLAGALIAGSAQRTVVVVDDYAYVLLHHIGGFPFELDDYASRSYLREELAPSKDPHVTRLWRLLSTRYIVSLGALGTVDRIYRSAPDLSKLSLRHARNMAARDFQDGSLILFGHAGNNPWTHLFEDKLNFQWRNATSGFDNLRPRAGALWHYAAPQSASINSGAGYARIALLRNLSGKDFVLLLSGLNMVTSEAAAEFASNPRYLPRILATFGARSVADLPQLEILLETSAFDSTPKDMRIIASRIVQPAR
jgi:hypothetical protein